MLVVSAFALVVMFCIQLQAFRLTSASCCADVHAYLVNFGGGLFAKIDGFCIKPIDVLALVANVRCLLAIVICELAFCIGYSLSF